MTADPTSGAPERRPPDEGPPESSDAQSGYVARARKDLFSGALWTVAGSLVGAPVALIANIVIAHSLGPVGLGRWGSYSAILAIALPGLEFGFNSATVQWLAHATARESMSARRDLIRWFSGFQLCVSAPALAVCLFILLASAGLIQAVVASAAVFVMEVLSTSSIINTASARNTLAARIALFSNVLNQAALVAVAATTRRADLTFVTDVACLTVGPIVGTLTLPHADRAALFSPHLTFRLPEGFPVFAVSSWLGNLVTLLVVSKTEVIILRADGFLRAAGLFTLSTSLAAQMTTPTDALMGPLPAISSGLLAIDRQRSMRLFGQSLKLTSITTTLAISVFAPIGILLIAPLYGEDYRAAAAPFAALALVSCFQSALLPVQAFATASRSAPHILVINVVCVALDAGIALSTIPILGMWGAVIANGSAQALSLVLLAIVVSRRVDMPLSEIGRGLGLFGLASIAVLPELGLCLILRGPFIALAVPACALTMLSIYAGLRMFPDLRLSTEQLSQLAQLAGSGRFSWLPSLLRSARLAD